MTEPIETIDERRETSTVEKRRARYVEIVRPFDNLSGDAVDSLNSRLYIARSRLYCEQDDDDDRRVGDVDNNVADVAIKVPTLAEKEKNVIVGDGAGHVPMRTKEIADVEKNVRKNNGDTIGDTSEDNGGDTNFPASWKIIGAIASYHARLKCHPDFLGTLEFEDARLRDIFHDVRDVNGLVENLRRVYEFLEVSSRDGAIGADDAANDVSDDALAAGAKSSRQPRNFLSHLRDVTKKVPALFDPEIVRGYVERESLLSTNDYVPPNWVLPSSSAMTGGRKISDWSDFLTFLCHVMFAPEAETTNQLAVFLLFKLTFLCALAYTACSRRRRLGERFASSTDVCDESFATIRPVERSTIDGKMKYRANCLADAMLFYEPASRHESNLNRSKGGEKNIVLLPGEWYVDPTDACSTVFVHAFFRLYDRFAAWPLREDARYPLNEIHALRRESLVAFFRHVGRNDQQWLAFFAGTGKRKRRGGGGGESGDRSAEPRLYVRAPTLLDEYDRLARSIRGSCGSGKATAKDDSAESAGTATQSLKIVASVEPRSKAFNDNFDAFVKSYAAHWKRYVAADARIRAWWSDRDDHRRNIYNTGDKSAGLSKRDESYDVDRFVERNTEQMTRVLLPYVFHATSHDRDKWRAWAALDAGASCGNVPPSPYPDGYTDEKLRDYLVAQMLGGLYKRGVTRDNCSKLCEFVERTRERYSGMINDFDLGAIYARMMSELSFIVDVFADAAGSLGSA